MADGTSRVDEDAEDPSPGALPQSLATTDPRQPFHQAEHTLERLGWVFLLLVALAAALGLLGGGVLGSARVASSDGRMVVEYKRIGHVEADDTMTVRVRVPASAAGSELTVSFTGSWVDDSDITGVFPEPTEFAVRPGGADVTWLVTESLTADAELVLHLSFRSSNVGLSEARVQVGESRTLLRRFTLP